MAQEQDQPDRRCKHCGTPLTNETTNGLCPRCLLEMNLASRTMPDGEVTPQAPPPSPEEMAERFPQFEILECLGRGGMGIVYKAWQKSLKRMVAIKVLAPERVGEPLFAEHFATEAQTLAKMSHPNIVTVHEFGESDGMFYLVMEFVDGVNLRDVLRDGRMESAQALAIVPEICEALQFAHDHGVVHRDIKPENILLDRDGRVKIADFGIAALVGADADCSGTPPYMAPEQQSGKGSVDSRADIYALGVVFYEMLTGKRPEQDPSRPSRRVEIDVRLDEIVLRALEKEPARRYQTAAEFRTVVETMAPKLDTGPAAVMPVKSESEDPGGMGGEGCRRVLQDNAESWIGRYGWLSLAAMGIGLLTWLGAIANFNFVLGVDKTPMMLVGGIVAAAGVVSAMIKGTRHRDQTAGEFKTEVETLQKTSQRRAKFSEEAGERSSPKKPNEEIKPKLCILSVVAAGLATVGVLIGTVISLYHQ